MMNNNKSKSKATVGPDGTIRWRNEEGLLHRDDGLPAVEGANGIRLWWSNGDLHREGGLPAIEGVNGLKEWYENGQHHRDGGLPAVVRADGHKEWWVNGKRTATTDSSFKSLDENV